MPRRPVRAALLGLLTAAATAAPSPSRAQSPAPRIDARFTAEDALDIATHSIADLTADGRWVATTAAVRRDGFGVDFRRDGDPTYVRPTALRVWSIDTRTGERRAVFPDARNVRAIRWSADGSRLGMLVLQGDRFVPTIWDRASGRTTTLRVPAGSYVAENSELAWTPDGAKLVIALRTDAWRKQWRDTFALYTAGPVFVQRSTDPFLAWEQLRRAGNLRSVVALDIRSGAPTVLIPEGSITSWDIAEDGSVVTYSEDVTKKTDYDVIFGTENRLVVRGMASDSTRPTSRTLLASLKGVTLVWSEDGRHYAYGKDGRVWIASVSDTARQIAGPPSAARADSAPNARDAADTSAEARQRRARERFTPVRYSPTNDAVLVSNPQGFWLVDVASGAKELIVPTDTTPASPRVTAAAWSGDGRQLYFAFASRTRWERGILRYDRSTKQARDLVRDGRFFSALRVARRGPVAVLGVGEGNRPADLYAADADLSSLRRLAESNPQLRAKRLGRTGLLTYLDADGHQKYGVVYYPPDYEQGKAYPTVFNVYEDFFDDTFDATANVLAAQGYVVVKPSVDFDIGYPGEAWVKGVTAAANKLIELGVTDSARVGVHGTSYGGYATNLLITQTSRFRAAINISGKVDVISFYTDSPRLGVRNVHAAEKSQDRLGATLWQQPQKYAQQSAVMFADRIQTPLLLITGEQDSNVPADNTREMFYALRRLGKEVVWVNYMNGGHGGGTATVEDFLDMHRRIVEWYDAKLKRAPGKVASH